jgi:parallel beta-helix repeat protein
MNKASLRLLVITVFLSVPSMLLAKVTPISTCGTVITASGDYALSADLSCSGDGVDIEANDVRLLLKGYTISGPGNYSGNSGVGVGGDGAKKTVTIVGPGSITNFEYGVIFYGTNGGGLVGVTFTGNPFSVYVANGSSLLIAQNTCNGNGSGFALDLSGIENSTIVGNNCANNTVGIFVGGSNNTFLGNTSSNNSGDGFQLAEGSGNTVRGNQFISNQSNGINNYASGNHFIGNLAQGNGSFDINENIAGCAGDTYKNDAFVAANQSCVK